MNFRLLINMFHFMRLKKTRKHRGELRHQRVIFCGQRMMAIDYLKKVNDKLPIMSYKHNAVDHYENLRKWYYNYDLEGVQYYLRLLGKSIKKQVNELKLQRDETSI